MYYKDSSVNSDQSVTFSKASRFGSIKDPWHGIPVNVVCATSKDSDQPAHTRSLIRAFVSRLNIL